MAYRLFRNTSFSALTANAFGRTGINLSPVTSGSSARAWPQCIGMALLTLLLLGLFMYIDPLPLQAQTNESTPLPALSIQQGMEQLDLEEIEEYKRQVDSEINDYLQGVSIKQWILDFMQGKWEFDSSETVK